MTALLSRLLFFFNIKIDVYKEFQSYIFYLMILALVSF